MATDQHSGWRAVSRRFLVAAFALQLAIASLHFASEGADGAVAPAPPPPSREPMQRTSAPASLVIQTPPPGIGSAAVLPTPTAVPIGAAARTPPPTTAEKVAAATVPLTVRTLPTASAMVGARPEQTSAPIPPAPMPPPRPRRFNFPYVPPLGMEEAGSLLRACIDILAINDAPTIVARCQKVSEIIEVTSHCLTTLDQRHSTLAAYEWHFVDREKVDGPGIDRDVFQMQPPVPRVSAISFSADFGNVYIYSVGVLDASGQTTTFTLNRLIEENYPHQGICHLFFPRTVQSITILYQPRGGSSRTPRLAVFAGAAREEEYLKQALWYLRYARRETEAAIQNPESAAPHLEAASENLRRAASRLIRYRVKSFF